MLRTDDLIRDTEKNLARGTYDDFTDLFKYAYEKGRSEAIDDILFILYDKGYINSDDEDYVIEKLKELKNG